MNNVIDLKRLHFTTTTIKEQNGHERKVYAIKQSQLDELGIRAAYGNEPDCPVFTLVDDEGKRHICTSAGPLSIPGTTNVYIGRKYNFGHWYYKHNLHIIDDKSF
ncbi:hypothetical protein MA9V2_153 [Chryseobacterium phage MA9V-2]|nr:hypothetical protein MA9V2_153 [Chryseobacterium phage MA9V-2]